MVAILTHRGLEPSKKTFYPESSYESFLDQIRRGFGIEFDPNFCKDGIVVIHDSTLKRITNNLDERKISDITISELSEVVKKNWKKGRISLFSEILELLKTSKSQIQAMHLKGANQTKEKIDILLEEIIKYPKAMEKLIIFDIKPEFARYIKSKLPQLMLAPSIAHQYDIERYNDYVLGTLISIEDAIRYKKDDLYDWAWLDEWDTLSENGQKKLYTKENFDKLRKAGYKIALVTPDLHGTSPGLLAGEEHADAKSKDILFSRIKEILSLNPDAVCTDYPEEVRKMQK